MAALWEEPSSLSREAASSNAPMLPVLPPPTAMAALMLLLQLVQPAQGNAIVKSLPCTMLLQKRWRQLSLLACMRAC